MTDGLVWYRCKLQVCRCSVKDNSRVWGDFIIAQEGSRVGYRQNRTEGRRPLVQRARVPELSEAGGTGTVYRVGGGK